MLMTPITPKVMARPMAASSSTEPSDRPYQAFCTIDHSARLRWMAAVAFAAALAIAAGWSPVSPVSSASASWSPRALMVAMASSFSASVASGLNSRMAARASVKASLARLDGFLLQRLVDQRQHGFVVRLEHRLRGLDPLGGIGRQQRQAAERGLDGAAQAVVEAHGGGAVGHARRPAAPVAASMILPSGWVT